MTPGPFQRMILVDAMGDPIGTVTNPLETAGVGVGGGGDASAANQLIEILRLEAVRDRIGATNDIAAVGDGSLIAIAKQLRTLLTASTLSVDMVDEDARILGRTKILDTFGIPIDARDVTDRDARLLGRTKHLNSGGAVIDPATEGTGLSILTGIGVPADAEAAGNGSLISLAKRLRTLLAGGLPAALVGGRLDVDVSDRAARLLGKAREDTLPMTWTSAKTAAPAIGAVQADTGALPAGEYDFDIMGVVSDTVAVGKGLVVEHRNAANGATLQTLGGCSTQGELAFPLRRYTIALNERLRIIAGTAAGAAASMYITAIGRRVS